MTSSHGFCVSSTPSWLVAAERYGDDPFGGIFWKKKHPLGTLECVGKVYRGVVMCTHGLIYAVHMLKLNLDGFHVHSHISETLTIKE